MVFGPWSVGGRSDPLEACRWSEGSHQELGAGRVGFVDWFVGDLARPSRCAAPGKLGHYPPTPLIDFCQRER